MKSGAGYLMQGNNGLIPSLSNGITHTLCFCQALAIRVIQTAHFSYVTLLKPQQTWSALTSPIIQDSY